VADFKEVIFTDSYSYIFFKHFSDGVPSTLFYPLQFTILLDCLRLVVNRCCTHRDKFAWWAWRPTLSSRNQSKGGVRAQHPPGVRSLKHRTCIVSPACVISPGMTVLCVRACVYMCVRACVRACVTIHSMRTQTCCLGSELQHNSTVKNLPNDVTMPTKMSMVTTRDIIFLRSSLY
jgi:hypothetical protein